MKGYLNYLFKNFKSGNYTVGLLIILTLIIFLIILSIGLTIQNRYVGIISVLWLFIGGAICISWNNYWYDKNKK